LSLPGCADRDWFEVTTFECQGGVARHNANDVWFAESADPELTLVIDPAKLEAGWVLLSASLVMDRGGASAYLVVTTTDGQRLFSLPATSKGRILELIQLPEGVTRIALRPLVSSGSFSLSSVRIRRVGRWDRWHLMWRRVLGTFWRTPSARRRQAGLFLWTPVFSLTHAYRLAGTFLAYAPSLSYSKWLDRFEQFTWRDRWQVRLKSWRLQSFARRMRVILDVSGASEMLVQRTLDSLAAQVGVSCETWLLDQDGAFIPAQSQKASDYSSDREVPDWTVWVKAGCELAPMAMFWIAHELRMHPETELLYSDHDYLDAKGYRHNPQFKPDWSEELALTTGYPGAVFAFRTDRVGREYTPAAGYALLLQLMVDLPASRVRHVPAVLWHQPDSVNAYVPDLEALRTHLRDRGVFADVSRTASGHLRIHYPKPISPPLVSIIIPTRDRLDLLQPCVESLLGKTRYPQFEILVVDNDSKDPAVLDFMAQHERSGQIRVLRYAKPFNFSAINNFAVQHARGELICLLNNDTEVITPDWLDEMVARLMQPGIGVVGAKLYFSDGRLQHAGDVVGSGGCAHHLHGPLARDEPGYMDRAVLAQDLSAVTAACLLTPRELYQSLGGLDEKNLAVAFNDVDYCLRVREKGLRVIFTPFAELYHHESVSRGKDESPESKARAQREVAYMRSRWAHVMRHDPFYNPNLSYVRPDFSLSPAPLVRKPWCWFS